MDRDNQYKVAVWETTSLVIDNTKIVLLALSVDFQNQILSKTIKGKEVNGLFDSHLYSWVNYSKVKQ